VTKSGQVSVDFPEGTRFFNSSPPMQREASHRNQKHWPNSYRSEHDPRYRLLDRGRYEGFSHPKEVRWEAVGSSDGRRRRISTAMCFITALILRCHFSTFTMMAVIPKGAVLWFSLHGKGISEKDWPQIVKFLNDGYEVFSFDFRGMGETA
jgi:hypothetical protein